MVNPLFFAGALYVLWRLSWTFNREVWVKTGVMNAVLNNLPDTVVNKTLVRAVFFQGTRDFAYDRPIDLIADVAALGVKGATLKLGIPVLQRIIASLGTRAVVKQLEAIPELVQNLSDLGRSFENLGEFAVRFQETLKFLEGQGKQVLEPGAKLFQEATDVALETVDFSTDIVDFAQAPDAAKAVGIGVKALKLIQSFIDLFRRASDLVEEVRPPTPPIPLDPGLRRGLEPPAAPVTPPPRPPGLGLPIGLQKVTTFAAQAVPFIGLLTTILKKRRGPVEFRGLQF